MSQLIVGGIPVSPFCQYALRENRSTWKFVLVIAVILVALAWFLFSPWVSMVCTLGIVALVLKLRPGFNNDMRMWLEINKNDHVVSEKLEEMLRVFYHYSEQDVYHAGVAENQFDSLWVPTYAQYFSGGRSLSGDISVSGNMYGLFASAGEFSGKMTGSMAPDSMSDLGAILILQNEYGQSVRIVVPHRKVAEQMLEAALASFTKDEITSKTLTSLQILRMSLHLPSKACVTFVSALRVLDQIVASCGKPLAERPRVKVYGREVSPGVVMSTALEVEGQRGIFIPTGYIKEVTDKLSEFLGPYRGDIKILLNGQGPFAPKEAQPTV